MRTRHLTSWAVAGHVVANMPPAASHTTALRQSFCDCNAVFKSGAAAATAAIEFCGPDNISDGATNAETKTTRPATNGSQSRIQERGEERVCETNGSSIAQQSADATRRPGYEVVVCLFQSLRITSLHVSLPLFCSMVQMDATSLAKSFSTARVS